MHSIQKKNNSLAKFLSPLPAWRLRWIHFCLILAWLANADVSILGGGSAWVEGTTHTAESGSNRLLIVLVYGEHNAGAFSATAMTYGTRSMTKIVEKGYTAGGNYSYTAAFYLKESEIALASSSTIAPTWSTNPNQGSTIESVFLGGVYQTTPIGDTASASINATATLTTAALTNISGDLVILGATGENNGTYNVNNSFTEAWEYTPGVNWGDAVAGYKVATGSNETPSVTLSTPWRQTLVGFVVRNNTRTWDGGGGSNNWQTDANWVGDGLNNPTGGEDIVFAGTVQTAVDNTYTAATSYNSFTFNSGAGAFTISGNSFTLGGDITNNDGDVQTISNNLILSSGRTINTTSGNITLSGVISGAYTLTKTGTNTLTLSGANTFSEWIWVIDGTLSINTIKDIDGGASAVGAPTSSSSDPWIYLGDGTTTGTLVYTGTAQTTNRPLDLYGTTGGGTINQSGSSGLLKFNGDFTVTTNGAKTLTLTGSTAATGEMASVIPNSGSGATSITKSGTGTWTLSGSSTYTGTTTVSAGILKLGAAGGATNTPLGTTGSGTIVSNGGALDLAGYTLGTAEALTLNGTGVSSGGALMNSGSAATYSGLVTLGTTGVSIVGGTGTIDLSNTGTITGSGYNLTLGGAQGGTISSIIGTGSGTLTKADAGTWRLTRTNTFTGAISVNAGTLRVDSNFASTSIYIANGAIFDDRHAGSGHISQSVTMTGTGTFLYNTGSTAYFGGGIDVQLGSGALILYQRAAGSDAAQGCVWDWSANLADFQVESPYGAALWGCTFYFDALIGSGAITLGQHGSVNLYIGIDNGSGTYSGTMAPTVGVEGGSIYKVGTGTQVLSATNSTHTVSTDVRNGTLSITSIKDLGTASSLGSPSTEALGTIDLGYTTTTGTLVYTGSTTSTNRRLELAGTTGGATLDQSGTGTLTFSNTAAYTASGAGSKTFTLQGSTAGTGVLAGVIQDNSGANKTSMTKSGTGTWTLSGTNTYTGNTTISAGTLLVTGTIASGSTVSVTGTLGGGTWATPGTVAGSITVNNTGTLAPGIGGTTIGKLSTGAVTFSTTSTYSVDLDGSTPTNDRITSTGTVALGSAVNTLTVASIVNSSSGDVYTIISASSVTGTFSGKANNSTFTVSGRTLRINYTSTAVTLTDETNYSGWPYKRNISINTTSTGANVSGNVTNFPMLVRLTSSNFTFSQAFNGGPDVRFSKSDGTVLYHEIERWDSANAVAEVWVKIDTVYGNNSSQYFTMYWGQSGVASSSNPEAVFDTANGFVSTWHFGNSILDATYNNYDLTNFGTTDVAGNLGRARDFVAPDSLRITNFLGNRSTLTISAWARLEVNGTNGAEVISLGDNVSLRLDNSGGSGVVGFYYTGTTWKTTNSGNNLVSTGWNYVTYVVNPSSFSQILYINGVRDTSNADGDAISYSLGSNTYIGVHANGSSSFNFDGQIDEVVVSKTARSADWVKLSYETQKSSSTVLTGPNWVSTGLGTLTGGAITEDAIYIGSESDTLYKLDLATGSRIWTYDASSYGNVSSPSYAYNTSTSKYDVFFTAGNYFVGVQDNGTTKTNLFAVDIAEPTGPPYVEGDDNYVYFASTGNIHKRSKTTGANAGGSWPITVSNVSLVVPPVIMFDEIHFATTDGYVRKYDMSGTLQNSYYCNCALTLPLHMSGNNLILTPSDKDSLIALNRSNYSRNWGFDLDANNTGAVYSQFAVDTFYIATGTKVQKIGVSGSTATRAFQYTAAVNIKSGPIMPDNMIWFGGVSGYIYKLSNAAGTLQTNFPYTSASGDADHGPWVDVTNNQMLYGTTSGEVGAFER